MSSLEHLQEVVAFLQEQGFDRAVDSIYEQVQRQQAASASRDEGVEDRADSPLLGAAPPSAAAGYEGDDFRGRLPEAGEEGRSRSADAVLERCVRVSVFLCAAQRARGAVGDWRQARAAFAL